MAHHIPDAVVTEKPWHGLDDPLRDGTICNDRVRWAEGWSNEPAPPTLSKRPRWVGALACTLVTLFWAAYVMGLWNLTLWALASDTWLASIRIGQ